jgi:membrane-bound lytic murein transglycosylase D
MRPFPSVLLIAAGAILHCALSPAIAAEPADTAPAAEVASVPPPEAPDGSSGNTAEIPGARIPAAAALPQAPALMDLTTAPASVWQRIRNGFGLPDMASPLVHAQEKWFASRPDYIKRTVERSSRYLFYIVQQVEKRGMPSEIALLPIVESAYNPVAYSRAHASGIWQFIPSTGKHYGLQQNFWYDGRRDVMAATNAALDYLEKLYDMFGSWDLALAAYNWGEGSVSRAIARNLAKGQPTDYQSLTMPRETRHYMPKLQAVKNIIANPGQYAIELAEVPNRPYFVAVTTTRHIDVKLAAKLADVPLEEFVSLNPGYSRPVIRVDGEQTLLLPADKADTFRANLKNHDQPLVSWRTYTLKAGDGLDRIAAKHGISLAHLKQINSISPRRKVGAGTTVLVPAAATADAHLPNLPAPPVAAAKASKKSGKRAQAARKDGAPKAKAVKKTATTPAKKTATQGTKKIVLAQQPR